jgi:hypothetical protein
MKLHTSQKELRTSQKARHMIFRWHPFCVQISWCIYSLYYSQNFAPGHVCTSDTSANEWPC